METWEPEDGLNDDRDQANPCEFSEGFDFAANWDFESDPDWQ